MNLDLLNQFLDGNLIVDCFDDPEHYAEFMDALDARQVCWRAGNRRFASDMEYQEVASEPFIWRFRMDGFGTRVLTKGSSGTSMKLSNPLAEIVSVREMMDARDKMQPMDLEALLFV